MGRGIKVSKDVEATRKAFVAENYKTMNVTTMSRELHCDRKILTAYMKELKVHNPRKTTSSSYPLIEVDLSKAEGLFNIDNEAELFGYLSEKW